VIFVDKKASSVSVQFVQFATIQGEIIVPGQGTYSSEETPRNKGQLLRGTTAIDFVTRALLSDDHPWAQQANH